MTPRGGADYDVIVIGSGVAGLSVALGLAGSRRVALVTSGPLQSGSTAWAQGGLAAAIGPGDDAAQHADDTVVAGVNVCDDTAVRILTDDAPTSLADLVRAGASLDVTPDGRLALTREGGHRRRRVVHAGGDATGAEVSRALSVAVGEADVEIIDNTEVIDLCTTATLHGSQVSGVLIERTTASRTETATLSARAVVLATGGVGGLFTATTNPSEVSGRGLALGLRAGASLVDLEFVQFHPTALNTGAATGQIPLVTEALRGEGAVLRDERGVAIMTGHHPLGDLAPRDIVARRIDEVMTGTGGQPGSHHVTLDATHLGADLLATRFPTVYRACREHGVDPASQPIPVTPVQHFLCGGIRTDSWGATDVPGLYAVGEVAATGIHGANRLASNSLIEAMVFGRRLASRLILDLPDAHRPDERTNDQLATVPATAISDIQTTMTRHAGIRRTAAGLETAAQSLLSLADPLAPTSRAASDQRLAAMAIVSAATTRRESRGCHWRNDHPASSEWWRRHVVVRLDQRGLPAASTTHRLERTA